MIKLYNTLTKEVEEIPKKDHINLYTCGPTVYNYAHIGNLRAFIVADLLYRTLKYEEYKPVWVMNITDIDDKTIKGALAKYGKDAGVEQLKEFTSFYYEEFLKDLKEVNVLVDEITFIKVTDVIPEIQEFVLKLLEKGYAYKAEDGVYFSIEKYEKDFGDYGQLVGEKFLEGKKVGARVAVDEYEKDNLSDFVLWKAHNPETDGQIFWEHESLGKGRPGWHIECSVINAIAFKGEPTDIHTGGVDLVFPHHTNEIAQSQALLGRGNFVKHWLHSEHLLVDGKKMAKRDGNFHTLRDIQKNYPYSAAALRYLFLQSHYRTQQNFTLDALGASNKGIHNLQGQFALYPSDHKFIVDNLLDDLNSPKALAENKVAAILKYLLGEDLDKLQESIIYPEIQELLQAREGAKQQKDFTKSDELRKQIEALGYEVLDTVEGQKVKKKI